MGTGSTTMVSEEVKQAASELPMDWRLSAPAKPLLSLMEPGNLKLPTSDVEA